MFVLGVQMMGRAQCGPKSWNQNAISGSHNKNYQQPSPKQQRRNNTSSNNHHNHSGGTTPAATITRCVAARFF